MGSSKGVLAKELCETSAGGSGTDRLCLVCLSVGKALRYRPDLEDGYPSLEMSAS
jgi:hypothetical protein